MIQSTDVIYPTPFRLADGYSLRNFWLYTGYIGDAILDTTIDRIAIACGGKRLASLFTIDGGFISSGGYGRKVDGETRFVEPLGLAFSPSGRTIMSSWQGELHYLGEDNIPHVTLESSDPTHVISRSGNVQEDCVRKVRVNSDGYIFCGTNQGNVYYIRPDHQTFEQTRLRGRVWALETYQDSLVAGTLEGSFYFNLDGTQATIDLSGAVAGATFVDNDRVLVAVRVSNSNSTRIVQLVKVTSEDVELRPYAIVPFSVSAISNFSTEIGGFFAGSYAGDVFFIDAHGWTRICGLGDTINSISVDEAQQSLILVGTEGGAVCLLDRDATRSSLAARELRQQWFRDRLSASANHCYLMTLENVHVIEGAEQLLKKVIPQFEQWDGNLVDYILQRIVWTVTEHTKRSLEVLVENLMSQGLLDIESEWGRVFSECLKECEARRRQGTMATTDRYILPGMRITALKDGNFELDHDCDYMTALNLPDDAEELGQYRGHRLQQRSGQVFHDYAYAMERVEGVRSAWLERPINPVTGVEEGMRTLEEAVFAALNVKSSFHDWRALKIAEEYRSRLLLQEIQMLNENRSAFEPGYLESPNEQALHLDPQTLCENIQDDTVILFYHTSGDRIALFCVSCDSREITALDAVLSPQRPSTSSFWLQHDCDIRSKIDGASRLLIVPPLDSLNSSVINTPFGAERSILFAKDLSVVPSLTSYHWSTHLSQDSPIAKKVLIFCDPESNLGENAEHEAASIETQLASWAVTRSNNNEVSKDFLVASIEESKFALIHLICHGMIDANGEPYLVLAEGDRLYGRDIAGIHTNGAVVVLSCCFGAHSQLTVGGDFAGITRAFLACGASGVVGSTTPVDNEGTARFMKQFYCGIADGQKPIESWRAACRFTRSVDFTYFGT